MAVVILAGLFILLIAGTIVLISQGFKKSAGIMTTTVLGANDMMMTNEQKEAAEVIVEMNAGKKFEEQSSKEPKNPGEDILGFKK